MSRARTYLFAVQDSTGRELVSCTRPTERVGEVSAAVGEDGFVRIFHAGVVVAVSQRTAGVPPEELRFLRWLASKKATSEPVSHAVDTL